MGDRRTIKELVDPSLANKTKEELLGQLDAADEELINFLSSGENLNRMISVPWSKESVKAMATFWALNNHEILHNGWNLALMDHLGMERFESMRKTWGE